MPISLLFSGHLIDRPGRKEPRFPARLEGAAQERIGQAVEAFVKGEAREAAMGFASCADGGDMIFHEQCRSRGIDTTIILPFPPETFLRESVAGLPDGTWAARFWRLWSDTAPERREEMGLPVSDAAYEACNTRLLDRAQRHGSLRLIALWDGRRGNRGGTADLIDRAKARTGPEDRDVFSPATLTGGR
jgi:hypothetical protein